MGSEHDKVDAIEILDESLPAVLRDQQAPAQRAFTVKVYGEERTLDVNEAKKYIQKGLAADQKFQEAAEQLKAAAKDRQIVEDLRTMMEKGDMDAFRRIGASMGIPGDEVEEAGRAVFQYVQDGGTYEEEEDDGSIDVGTQNALTRKIKELEETIQGMGSGEVKYGQLSPDVQRALRVVEKERINNTLQKAIDKDEVIGYYMRTLSDDGKAAIRDLVDHEVRGRLSAAGGDFGEDGSAILKEVIPFVRNTVERIAKAQRSTPQLGFGPSPGGGDMDVYPREKPKHLPSSHPDFDDSITQNIAYHLAQASRGQ